MTRVIIGEDPRGRVTTHITSFMHCGAMQAVGTIRKIHVVPSVSTTRCYKQNGIYR